jgi:hypothetical protein
LNKTGQPKLLRSEVADAVNVVQDKREVVGQVDVRRGNNRALIVQLNLGRLNQRKQFSQRYHRNGRIKLLGVPLGRRT